MVLSCIMNRSQHHNTAKKTPFSLASFLVFSPLAHSMTHLSLSLQIQLKYHLLQEAFLHFGFFLRSLGWLSSFICSINNTICTNSFLLNCTNGWLNKNSLLFS